MPGGVKRRRKGTSLQSAAVQSWAQKIGNEELLCRDLGHVWHPDTARFDQRQHAFQQTLLCPRCTTLRRRVLGENGEILRSSYTYPRTYLAPKGVGSYDSGVRSVLRLASITRVINEAAEAARRNASVVTDIANARKSK